jgi:hypothetical protein
MKYDQLDLLSINLRQAMAQFEQSHPLLGTLAVKPLIGSLVPFFGALCKSSKLRLYHIPPFKGSIFRVKSEATGLVFEASESHFVNYRTFQYSALVARDKATLMVSVLINERLIARRSLTIALGGDSIRYFDLGI